MGVFSGEIQCSNIPAKFSTLTRPVMRPAVDSNSTLPIRTSTFLCSLCLSFRHKVVLFMELATEMLIRPKVCPRLVVRVISRLLIANIRFVSAISGSAVSEDLVVTVEAGPVIEGLPGPGEEGFGDSSRNSRSGCVLRGNEKYVSVRGFSYVE